MLALCAPSHGSKRHLCMRLWVPHRTSFSMEPKPEPRIMPDGRAIPGGYGSVCAWQVRKAWRDGGQSHMEKPCQLFAQLHYVSHCIVGNSQHSDAAVKIVTPWTCDVTLDQNTRSLLYNKSRTLVRIGRLGIRALRSPMILGRQPAETKAQPHM